VLVVRSRRSSPPQGEIEPLELGRSRSAGRTIGWPWLFADEAGEEVVVPSGRHSLFAKGSLPGCVVDQVVLHLPGGAEAGQMGYPDGGTYRDGALAAEHATRF